MPLLSVFCLLLLGVIIVLVYKLRCCGSKRPELEAIDTNECKDEEQPPAPVELDNYEEIVSNPRAASNESTQTAKSNHDGRLTRPSRSPSSSGYPQTKTQQTDDKPLQKTAKNCDSTYQSLNKTQPDNDEGSSHSEHIYMGLLKTNRLERDSQKNNRYKTITNTKY